MNILGIGGPELLLIMAVGLYVLGPKRLMEAVREGKRVVAELRSQRDQLKDLLKRELELDEMKKQLEAEKFALGAKEIEKELSLEQIVDVPVPNGNNGSAEHGRKKTGGSAGKQPELGEPGPAARPTGTTAGDAHREAQA